MNKEAILLKTLFMSSFIAQQDLVHECLVFGMVFTKVLDGENGPFPDDCGFELD